MHILEHKAVMADPELRKDPDLVRNAQMHIQQHIDLLRNGDPDLLQLLGEQPLNPVIAAGQQGLPPGPMNNQEVLDQSNMQDMTMNPQAQKPNLQAAGQPETPTPPAPFQNMPTNPKDM
jgi:hypothetical protein